MTTISFTVPGPPRGWARARASAAGRFVRMHNPKANEGGTDDEFEDNMDDEFEESVGSCDHCNEDLYESTVYDIDGDQLCDQCAWYVLEAQR